MDTAVVTYRAGSVLRSAWPALVLATVLLAPFHHKAFTIDDTLFLEQAAQVLKDPVHPTAFETVWSEAPVPLRMSAIMPSGPVMAYLLVPSILLGGAEWAAHLAVVAALLLAIVATASLALRLGLDEAGARWCALLLAGTPAALGMAATAMPDVPAMAFGALGLERSVAFRQDRRAHQAVLAAAALALAALSRPHSILLVFVAGLVFVALGRSPRKAPRGAGATWLPLVAAPVLFLAVLVLTRDPQTGAGAAARAAGTFSGWIFGRANLVAFAAHWVLAVPLALPWAAMRWRSLLRSPFLYVGAIGGAAHVATTASDYAGYWPVVGLMAGIGLAFLVDVFVDAWAGRDRLQAALAATLLVPAPVIAYIHLPPKYLLVSVPAATILLVRAMRAASPGLVRPVLAATVALGAALGLMIVQADATFAGLARRAAAEWIAPRVAEGRRVWFSGHWGFQWYAEKAGARPMTATPPLPVAGDFLVVDLGTPGFRIYEAEDLVLVAKIEAGPGGRLVSGSRCAGFYSNAWGYLPWTWSGESADRLALFSFTRSPRPSR